MNRSNSARNVAAAIAALAATLLAGCSWTGSIFTSDKVQYETAQTRPALEVPPDLSQLPRDERFLVPDRPQTITASGQGQRPGAGPVATGAPVVPAGGANCQAALPNSVPRSHDRDGRLPGPAPRADHG